jgi:alkanesulfonate monooxygenase SsuD/methylene tetrahydromethanopterin reductase-like flavin-dependent oxidoreductase (luciferase family)
VTEPHPFRFGVVVGPPGSSADWTATAHAVEDLGYDLLLMPDTRFTPSPFPALAAAAAVTSRLRVGTWVLAAPLRTPAAVVRETAALQLLSDGRFELGIGTGRPAAAEEARLLGMPWGTATDRIRQVLEVMKAVRRAVVPEPHVTVAASGPRMLAAAADAGAGTIALALSPSATRDDVARAADAARAPRTDPELALQISGVGGRLVGHLARQGLDPDALRDAAAVLPGGPDDMAAALIALRAATGVSFFPVAVEHADAFAPVLRLLRSQHPAAG